MCHGLGLHSHIGGWSSIHFPMVLGIFISRDGDGFKKDMALACSGMLWHALACSGNGKPGSLRVMEGPKNLGLSPENLTQGPGFVSYGRCFFFKLHG